MSKTGYLAAILFTFIIGVAATVYWFTDPVQNLNVLFGMGMFFMFTVGFYLDMRDKEKQ